MRRGEGHSCDGTIACGSRSVRLVRKADEGREDRHWREPARSRFDRSSQVFGVALIRRVAAFHNGPRPVSHPVNGGVKVCQVSIKRRRLDDRARPLNRHLP